MLISFRPVLCTMAAPIATSAADATDRWNMSVEQPRPNTGGKYG